MDNKSANEACLYCIRIYDKPTQKYLYVSTQKYFWYYFIKPSSYMRLGEQTLTDRACLRNNLQDAALFANKKNALKAIRDATRCVKEWECGYTSLPIDECEATPIRLTIIDNG